MKKIVVLLLFILTITNVKAASSINLDCPSAVGLKESIKCKIVVKDGYEFKSIKGSLNTGDLTFKEFKGNVNFTEKNVDSNEFSLVRNENYAPGTIGTLVFNLPSSAKSEEEYFVKVSDIIYDNNADSSITKYIRVKSNDNLLSKLIVDGYKIDFNPETLKYTIDVEEEIIFIKAVAEHSSALVSGTGNKKLKAGKNEFKVIVTAEDGSARTYVIEANRKDERSSNNSLKTLTVDTGTIEFSKTQLTYDLEVEKSVESIKIDATLEDEKSIFVKNYGPRTVTLKYGENKILIKVKAENDSEKTYTINVTRKDGRSSDNTLASLEVSPVNIEFDNEATTYRIEVGKDVDLVEIDAKANDEKAEVEIEEPDVLIYGNNVFKVIVTAENGSKKIYTINVNKLETEIETNVEEEKVLSNNANVKSISINNHNIEFDSDKKEYEIETDDKKLSIQVELENENAEYEIIGNENLAVGRSISIDVTAEDGTKNRYNIKIIGSKLSLVQGISLVVVWVGIIIASIVLIKKK